MGADSAVPLESSGLADSQAPAGGSRNTCAILTVAAVSWAPILFGMSLGFTGPAMGVMKDDEKRNGVHVNIQDRSLVVFSKDEADLFSSFINIGCIFGSIFAGPVSQKLGRKLTILAIAPLIALAWFFTGFFSSFPALFACRIICGIAVGITSSVVPTYINEIAPTSLRGAFGATFQVGVVVGIMLVYLLGAYVFITTDDKLCQWRYLAYFMVVPSMLLFVCASFAPESPAWLASQGRLDEALRNLKRLRGGIVEQEMQDLRDSSASSGRGEGGGNIRDLLRNPRVVSIGMMLMIIQQFSGVNAVIFFQDTIFEDAGRSDAASLGFYVMLVQVVVTSASIPLIDTAGRKILLITATVGMAICCVGMWYFFLNKTPQSLALVGSFAYISFFAIGLGPVPWLMMSEIFPQSFRSLACSCGAALNWLCSFITTLTINKLAGPEAVHLGNVFLMYGAVLVFGTLYVALVVPETKGRSLVEIERMLGIQQRDVALLSCQ